MLKKVADEVARCHERAIEFRSKAEDAPNEAVRRDYLDAEHRWLILARSYEFSDRLTNYTNDLTSRLFSEPMHPVLPFITCPKCGSRMRLATVEPGVETRDGER